MDAEAKGLDPEVRQKRMTKQATKTFAEHQISIEHLGPHERWGHWLLQKRYSDGTGWDWTCAVEIVCLSDCSIHVGGDYSPTVFAHGPQDAVTRIHWMGTHEDIDGYVAEKASIGMGGRGESDGIVSEYDAEVAIWHLNQQIEERKKYFEDCREDQPPDNDKVIWALEYAKHGVYDGYHMMMHSLHSADLGQDGYDWLFDGPGSTGIVTSGRLIWGHAAVRRLSQLLLAREKAA